MEKKTPLYDRHVALGGRMVPFAGFVMPVQYKTGILQEHTAVRSACGLFDVSHMGEFLLTGKDAKQCVQHLVTRDIAGILPGQVSYSPVCNEEGGVVDDILIYCIAEDVFFLVVNAANTQKDAEWVTAHLLGDTAFENLSDGIAQIAVQGPQADGIVRTMADALPEKYYTFIRETQVCGKRALVSRTGYTGEDGFEIYAHPDDIGIIWDALVERGAVPCGLGARDTLRLEAAMPLYGHEMDDTVMPYEAGIGFFVNDGKEDFIGKDALTAKKAAARKRIGLEVTDRGIPRSGDIVLLDGKEVGVVTSGTQSPTFKKPIAMARVSADAANRDTYEVQAKNRVLHAKRLSLPFYKRNK